MKNIFKMWLDRPYIDLVFPATALLVWALAGSPTVDATANQSALTASSAFGGIVLAASTFGLGILHQTRKVASEYRPALIDSLLFSTVIALCSSLLPILGISLTAAQPATSTAILAACTTALGISVVRVLALLHLIVKAENRKERRPVGEAPSRNFSPKNS